MYNAQALHTNKRQTNPASKEIALPAKKPATKLAEVLPLPKASPVPSKKPNLEALKKQIEQISDPDSIKELALFVQQRAINILGYAPRQPKISYHQKLIDGKFYWYAAWSEEGKSQFKYVGTTLPPDLDPSHVSIKYHPSNPDNPSLSKSSSPASRGRRR